MIKLKFLIFCFRGLAFSSHQKNPQIKKIFFSAFFYNFCCFKCFPLGLWITLSSRSCLGCERVAKFLSLDIHVLLSQDGVLKIPFFYHQIALAPWLKISGSYLCGSVSKLPFRSIDLFLCATVNTYLGYYSSITVWGKGVSTPTPLSSHALFCLFSLHSLSIWVLELASQFLFWKTASWNLEQEWHLYTMTASLQLWSLLSSHQHSGTRTFFTCVLGSEVAHTG